MTPGHDPGALPPPFLAYWVDDISPFLIRFHGNIGIRYYGLAYLLGFLAAAYLLRLYARTGHSLLPEARIADLMAALVVGVLLGGRLGYFVFYEPGMVRSDPLVVLKIWEGGMASHGGMIGVAVALAWFGRATRLRILHLGDLVVSVAPAGLFFGRIANFINGELWGKMSTVPWAVIFPRSDPGTPVPFIAPRHPSQLYEALLEGCLLLVLMQIRFWRTNVVRERPGRLSGEFFIAYALVRMVGEVYREPDVGVPLVFGMSRGTFYSLFLVLAGVFLWVRPSKPLVPPQGG
jgi:phosphatidylglycerol:prolipoprotein diacylglycerol transferase